MFSFLALLLEFDGPVDRPEVADKDVTGEVHVEEKHGVVLEFGLALVSKNADEENDGGTTEDGDDDHEHSDGGGEAVDETLLVEFFAGVHGNFYFYLIVIN